MKKLMKLRNKKGFTLVELIIVIAIIAILLACVAAFAGPVQKIVKSSAASADALQVNKIIGDYIENRLAYASYIDVHVGKNVNSLQGDLSEFVLRRIRHFSLVESPFLSSESTALPF